MNIIFLGSAQFAVPSLEILLKTKHKISCVVTQPDKKKGRGLHLEGTPVKLAASGAGLKIYQPGDINSSEEIEFLKSFGVDLVIVIAYGQILSKAALSIPRIFCINSHASILPKYRGAAPINWAIIMGEETTGVTIMKLEEKMDAGPVIAYKEMNIANDDTADSLENKLSYLAAELLINSLNLIEEKKFQLIPQDNKAATFAPKLKKRDGLINWDKPAGEIYNLIRGCFPWPGALTYYNGKLVKIFKARVTKSPPHGDFLRPPSRGAGEIAEVTKNGILIITKEDNLLIEELQIEGKKRMSVEEFISGHKIQAGEKFTSLQKSS